MLPSDFAHTSYKTKIIRKQNKTLVEKVKEKDKGKVKEVTKRTTAKVVQKPNPILSDWKISWRE